MMVYMYRRVNNWRLHLTLNYPQLTDKVEIVVNDRFRNEGRVRCVEGAAQVLKVEEPKWQSCMMYARDIFRFFGADNDLLDIHLY